MNPHDSALKLARKLSQAGHLALFAGGCVRDRLLGVEPKDYDIATSATPQEVLRLFPGSNEVGAHFGVVIVRHHGHATEIATFRTDGSYKDGRRPESVEFSTPEEDAARRDFTINALFENPETGEIIDHVGGLADLQTRTLRTVGNPEDRFQEDALRLLRAVRFATRLGFTLEPATWAAIQQFAPSLQRISVERIRDEFSRILTGPHRALGIELLTRSGLIDIFLPELRDLIGCDQPPQWHPEGDVYTHTRIMLDMLDDEAPLALVLAVLLHDIAKPPTRTVDPDGRIRFNGHDALGATMAENILRRLKYPNSLIDDVAFMVSRHMQFMHVQDMRTAKLKRFMATPTFIQELELHRVDCASSNGFTDNYDFLVSKRGEFDNSPTLPTPLLNGRDLIARGLSPSPTFREILDDALTEQLEGRFPSRDSALAWLDNRLNPQVP
ncbi:poly(A) polymerase [Haloferula luteola]|uniref:Poly(A) polymerase n=1 Tax=Haloferula luteola TaxID=595692 RepID=A0A840VIT7_9BACT|nr:CCA tRNA nucleotidyltransferase [Haloferula luteola]MBB5353770.1 poly(A) polymerase [Haloferula luteola]